MPITIQEIIASDTISQLVDKTNFNFDQLLLNGGGPAGPIGLKGPTGPAGGRGPKGSTWYEDASTTTPGVSPNVTAPTGTPLSGDYYLQFNGQVWEYNGTTWVITTVDLQGPTGPAGTTGGFGSFFGQGSISNFNTVLPTPKGIGSTGATSANEGILSVLIGGGASNTDTADSGITLTSAYKLTDALALSMASDVVSLMVHQKNTGSRALVFHGGADATNSELMEQTQLGVLSAIKLEIDDRLTVDIPKAATTVVGMSNTDVIGYQVSTLQRSQSYVAGNQIIMSSGNNAAPYGYANENSNIEITVNNGSSGGTGNKFRLVTTGSAGSGVFEIGNNVAINQAPQLPANINANATLTAGSIDLVSSQTGKIQLVSGKSVTINTAGYAPFTGSIDLTAGTGGLILGSKGYVNLAVQGAANANDLTIQNQYNGSNNSIGQVYITSNKDIAIRKQTLSAINAPSIVLNYTNSTAPHTRFVGEQTWTIVGQASQGPILSDDGASIYKYSNLNGALADGGLFSAYERVGEISTTDFMPGSSLQQWMLGTGVFNGSAAGQISLSIGNESFVNPVPATYVNSGTPDSAGMYDGSLDKSITLQVSDAETLGTNQYFSSNIQKTAIGNAFVMKRTQSFSGLNAGNNSPTASSNSVPYDQGMTSNYPNYGVDLLSDASLATLIPTSDGMPTTAEIGKSPFIILRFGFQVGKTIAASQISPKTATGYDFSFKFPIGAYPGQRIIVIIENYAMRATLPIDGAGNNAIYECYGTSRVNFPIARRHDNTIGVWTDWYANGSQPTTTSSVSDGTRGYQQSSLITTQADGQAGRVKTQTLELIWDGTIVNAYAKDSLATPFPVQNGDRVYTQFGWKILGASFVNVFKRNTV